ncbi:MAG: hypothetical protein M4D80_00220 [Myxococcota bacterium]|nr:hypothetical protein [Myxococcota bacterium]
MRCLPLLVGSLMIGCAAGPVNRVETQTTPALRMEWLRAEVARAEVMTHGMMGAYLPRATPGAHLVCSMAIQIDAWYGFGDERWELTKADTDATMSTVRPSSNMREELARIGIRDCVLDLNR